MNVANGQTMGKWRLNDTPYVDLSFQETGSRSSWQVQQLRHAACDAVVDVF